MNVTLSWDLFIIVFFAVIMTYTYIIGKHETVKIILASYIALVCVQAVSSILDRFAPELGAVWATIGLTPDIQMISVTKLFFFIAIVLFLAIRGGFRVEYSKDENAIINGVITGLVGFATGGLLMATLLTYIAGLPLLDASLATNASLSPIVQQSPLMQIMIFNQDLWFSLPALVLVVIGFLGRK